MPSQPSSIDQYSSWMGLIYVFNIIVGTGALTLPAVFARAGWALGLCFIIVLAFLSFMTVTFVIETMACANAVMHWQRLGQLKRNRSLLDSDLTPDDSEDDYHNDDALEEMHLVASDDRFYELDHQVELGEMAAIFFNTVGRTLFYICLCVYLYGDLSIYCAAVAESLVDVTCSTISQNISTVNASYTPCWDIKTDSGITRLTMYRLFLTLFVVSLGPFAFFNVQKTKYLQLLTTIFRWIAFLVMIGLGSWRIYTLGPQGNPPIAALKGVPALFGACIYSFMCHHSLPSLVAPIAKKSSLQRLLSCDYILICLFYLVLALTGAFAFAKLEDLYTLNFVPNDSDSVFLEIVQYFLSLFPVFTLSTSFPVIAITLRNNLQALFLDKTIIESYSFIVRRVAFPVLAVLPPFMIALGTDSLTGLVGFTGSYAGTGVQYLVPIALVYAARKQCATISSLEQVNMFKSPFKHNAWLVLILVWSFTCIIFVSVNLFTQKSS